jgi:urea ABC transporter permease protein UrtB
LVIDVPMIIELIYDGISFISIILLVALGLGIIFGIMGIINLAHGEFLMLGAYIYLTMTNLGISPWISFLIAAPLTGVLGIVVERTIIRPLYGRRLDTLLATWGLSIVMIQMVRIIYGPHGQPTPNPLPGSLEVLGASFSSYRVFLFGATAVLYIFTYALFRYTDFGLKARATMHDEAIAATLGINTKRIYMYTFGIGTAITGLSGALIAPIVGVVPTMGVIFIARSFLAVTLGGSEALLGTLIASFLLGTVESVFALATTAVFGLIALLLAASLFLRIRPEGIFPRIERR